MMSIKVLIPIPKPTQIIPIMSSLTHRHVAVVGAGAGGLVAARELRREGHNVVIFEKNKKVGGTWIYTAETESDPSGIDPKRSRIHSSMYKSLRTNLPREAMGFMDFPFVESGKTDRDGRRFPGHMEVLEYLNEFADEFGVRELVRFETEVCHVASVDGGKWVVKSRKNGGEDQVDEVYDAVVICNGHYSEPRIPQIPGIDAWPGQQIHSHNYRVPDPFQDQVVILIGSSASAVDISRDISPVAKQVCIADRSRTEDTSIKLPGYDNLYLHSMITSAHEDGTVIFHDGGAVRADIILHCTGYKYHFPFLETNGMVTVDDNRVGPLYKHIFPPLLAPSLSFVGLPWKVTPFPQCEYQSKWIAGVLSGRISLPSAEDMMKDVESFYSSLEESGFPKRYTHNMTNCQFEYNSWLAGECGCPPTEEWRKQMYMATSKSRQSRPETYRDVWDDDDSISLAHQHFKDLLAVRVGL